MVPIAIEVIGENYKDCVNIEIETIRTVDTTGNYVDVKIRCDANITTLQLCRAAAF